MKIVLYEIENHMYLSPQQLFTLIVESPQKMFSYSSMLIAQCDGKSGEFVLSKDSKILDFGKNCVMLYNYFDMDFNAKNITSMWNKKLGTIRASTDFVEKLESIYQTIVNLIRDLEYEFDIALDCQDEVEIQTLLKAVGTKIQSEHRAFLDCLIAYIDVLYELKPFSVLFLLHLHAFLAHDEIKLLVKHCMLKEISIVALESSVPSQRLEGERRLIIDKDLCEILN